MTLDFKYKKLNSASGMSVAKKSKINAK